MLETIFYHVDNFCKEFEKFEQKTLLNNGKKRSPNKGRMCLSEVMTICILYHYSKRKNFKAYYEEDVMQNLQGEFKLVSYNRFIELKQKAMLPLFLFSTIISKQNCKENIYIIDSYPLKVCHNKRISQNKVFRNLAKRGKSSMGWFFGFKLHIVINHLGEIVAFSITTGNVADNNNELVKNLMDGLSGKLFGDKGYISAELFEDLWEKGIHLVTKIRENMKNKLMEIYDKLLLRKRGVIESVGNILKNIYNLEHTRYRNPVNFFVNIFSTITAYFFKENKPKILKQEVAYLKTFC